MAASGTASAPRGSSYARGARILSVGIAATGLFSFAYFSVASHVLDAGDYGRISLLWSVLYVTMSVIYRPVEQLLSRMIAERRARGLEGGHPLRRPAAFQATFAALYLIAALALRGPIQDGLFDGEAALYWILVGATLAYGASYFARGYLAGHQWFGLYGGLVLFEAVSRFLFPLAVALGILTGETWVAAGIAAAPVASLLVLPWALKRHVGAATPEQEADGQRAAMRRDAQFTGSVAVIQLAEQTLLNAAVLLVSDSVIAGVVFSALLVTRAPLQLFQAVQTSLLPHLTALTTTEGRDAFDRAIHQTVKVIAGFAGLVALVLLAIGPFAMHVLFGDEDYGRVGLAVIAVGMGFHLAAGTVNQALLARGHAHQAAGVWLVSAVLFVAWMLLPWVSDELLRAEVGYAGATAVLAAALWWLARRGVPTHS